MHGTWDTCLIGKSIGSNVKTVAYEIIGTITPAQREQWTQASNPRDWANESYAIARAPGTKYCVIQGAFCNKPSGDVAIDANYVDTDGAIVRLQLAKAGARLAHLLNAALAGNRPVRDRECIGRSESLATRSCRRPEDRRRRRP